MTDRDNTTRPDGKGPCFIGVRRFKERIGECPHAGRNRQELWIALRDDHAAAS